MANQTGFKKALISFNALIATATVGLSFYLMFTGYYVGKIDKTQPTLLGNVVTGNDELSERFFDWSSYFTILSNIVVMIVMWILVFDPLIFNRRDRKGTIWRALRLDSLLMITITGIVYNLLLAGGEKTGLDFWSNNLQHVINPLVTVVVWLIAGPRGHVRGETILHSLVLPIIWAVYVLIRGTVIHAYPYFFFDVAKLGWASVLTFIAEIMGFAVVIGFAFLVFDKVMSKR
jgi:hypothetical protein